MTELSMTKRTAAAHLGRSARQVHHAVLASYATAGQAPSPAALHSFAVTHDIDLAAALAELTTADLIVTDTTGALRAAYPFSATPTPHRVTISAGPTVFAMCALDALGMSAMLDRPVTITSQEPDAAHTIVIQVNRDHARWTPGTAVVFTGTTGACCAPSADRTCGQINFFTTADAAQDWATRHPEITGSVLDQHHALTDAITEFGDLLHDT